MEYFPIWDAYGASALIKKDNSENWTFTQFNSGEICNTFDDDYDGTVDEGCDDDQDSYADSQLPCPRDNRFYTWMYNSIWKVQRNWADNGLWVYENEGWNWYQKETSSSIGTGWRWSSLSCNTNSGDTDDTNPSTHPGSITPTICQQNIDRFDNTQINNSITEWKQGQHTLIEILRRAKLWKFCQGI